MAYCSKCGVEVDADRIHCPLCQVPIHRYDEESGHSSLWPIAQEMTEISKRKNRFLTFLPLHVILFIAFFVILTVDLRMNGTLTWSRYSLTSLGSVILSLLGITLFAETKIVTVGWVTGTVLIMLSLLDSFNTVSSWFLTLGVPLTLITALYSELTIVGIVSLGKKYWLQISLQSILVTLYCLAIDYIISDAGGVSPLTWSLIVAVPLMVLLGFTLFFNLVLKRFVDIEKYLHR
jgi:hypothetical protein